MNGYNAVYDPEDTNVVQLAREALERQKTNPLKRYTTRVIGLFDDDACFIRVPDEVLKELGWKSMDNVEWLSDGFGTYSLKKK